MGNTNGEWISVDDKLPDELSEVLVYCKWDNAPLIAHHDGKYWYEKCDNLDIKGGDAWADKTIHSVGIGDVGYQITHWMQLPELPKA